MTERRENRVIPPPTIDPTLNVKEAMAAAVTRLNDIREADREHAKEMRDVQDKYAQEVATLRERLSEKESSRLDAIAAAERARVDSQFLNTANALALASEKQGTAAAALAQSVVASAEVLRAAAAAQNSTTTAAIRALEQNQFQSGGVQTGVRQQIGDTRSGNAAVYSLIGLVVTLLVFLMGAVTFVIARMSP